jgi:hypothetical protein
MPGREPKPYRRTSQKVKTPPTTGDYVIPDKDSEFIASFSRWYLDDKRKNEREGNELLGNRLALIAEKLKRLE